MTNGLSNTSVQWGILKDSISSFYFASACVLRRCDQSWSAKPLKHLQMEILLSKFWENEQTHVEFIGHYSPKASMYYADESMHIFHIEGCPQGTNQLSAVSTLQSAIPLSLVGKEHVSKERSLSNKTSSPSPTPKTFITYLQNSDITYTFLLQICCQHFGNICIV